MLGLSTSQICQSSGRTPRVIDPLGRSIDGLECYKFLPYLENLTINPWQGKPETIEVEFS